VLDELDKRTKSLVHVRTTDATFGARWFSRTYTTIAALSGTFKAQVRLDASSYCGDAPTMESLRSTWDERCGPAGCG